MASKLVEEHSSALWHSRAQVEKWDLDQVRWVSKRTGIRNPSGDLLRSMVIPSEIVHAEGNVLTLVGLAYLWSNITGLTTTVAARALAYGYLPVGVGDGNGSVPTTSASDTDLTATTNKYYQPVDANYPTVGSGVSSGVLTVQATFGTGVANFAWNEWGLFGATATFIGGQTTTPTASTLINHKGASLGTKSSATWTLSSTITIS